MPGVRRRGHDGRRQERLLGAVSCRQRSVPWLRLDGEAAGLSWLGPVIGVSVVDASAHCLEDRPVHAIHQPDLDQAGDSLAPEALGVRREILSRFRYDRQAARERREASKGKAA